MKTNTIEKKKFVDEPVKLEIVPCYACEGLGYYQSLETGELSLCDCVKKLCEECPSDKYLKPLRMIYLEEKNGQVPCKCMNQSKNFNRIKKLYDSANIPEHFRKARVETIEHEHDKTASLFAAKDTISEFLATSPVTNQASPLGFYMYGGTGCGKTHLAISILNVMILKYGIQSRYCKFSKDFINALKASYNKKDDWGDQELDSSAKIEKELQTVPVLVIDDFGVTKDSDWSLEKTYDLLTTRLEANRITIITSNTKMEDLAGVFSNRIFSRLCEMTRPIEFLNIDYRVYKRQLC